MELWHIFYSSKKMWTDVFSVSWKQKVSFIASIWIESNTRWYCYSLFTARILTVVEKIQNIEFLKSRVRQIHGNILSALQCHDSVEV